MKNNIRSNLSSETRRALSLFFYSTCIDPIDFVVYFESSYFELPKRHPS